MTTSRQFSELEGEFTSKMTVDFPCPKRCGNRRITCQLWESSDGGYEDNKYTCQGCGHVWWVDGPDA
jgi:hypothetical protein